jgi:hypothetical protein
MDSQDNPYEKLHMTNEKLPDLLAAGSSSSLLETGPSLRSWGRSGGTDNAKNTNNDDYED